MISLRKQLDADGLDAGPVTIAQHLAAEGVRPPSTSTIRRILHAAGLVVANPKKRPRSSLHRFAADQPNECWQSDFTHWSLADGTSIEILNWLDDHARYLLSITAFIRVTGDDVVTTFTSNVNAYGPPASTLTDNGSVYTSRFTGGITSTQEAASPCAAPAACTTSASGSATAEPPSSSCSTRPAPPSPTGPPAKSSADTPSTPPGATGATQNESPADGRALNNDATHLSTMSRLITLWSQQGSNL
ncbi:MAG TPA: DDE-type integrase/transposase/recombinase [Mycobacteriales bacterium]|nr:DDE-type integrase/transposase/recombinase [Mycobacteriales bacterium]